jgi:hypothetical protein
MLSFLESIFLIPDYFAQDFVFVDPAEFAAV